MKIQGDHPSRYTKPSLFPYLFQHSRLLGRWLQILIIIIWNDVRDLEPTGQSRWFFSFFSYSKLGKSPVTESGQGFPDIAVNPLSNISMMTIGLSRREDEGG